MYEVMAAALCSSHFNYVQLLKKCFVNFILWMWLLAVGFTGRAESAVGGCEGKWSKLIGKYLQLLFLYFF